MVCDKTIWIEGSFWTFVFDLVKMETQRKHIKQWDWLFNKCGLL